MHARVPWAVGQVVVAALMFSTIMYAVTGLLWWMALNALAAMAGLAAAGLFAYPGPAMQAATTAAALYAPFSLFVALMIMFQGPDVVGWALCLTAIAQVLLAWDAILYAKRQQPPADPTLSSGA